MELSQLAEAGHVGHRQQLGIGHSENAAAAQLEEGSIVHGAELGLVDTEQAIDRNFGLAIAYLERPGLEQAVSLQLRARPANGFDALVDADEELQDLLDAFGGTAFRIKERLCLPRASEQAAAF